MKKIQLHLIALPLWLYLSSSCYAQSMRDGWYQISQPSHLSVAEAWDEIAHAPQKKASTLMTATSEESVSTKRFEELAAALQNNPVRMFEYVRNTIDYIPYYGKLKGAGRTLLDRAGNDADQADLLIRLLTEAGYTAKFVYGTMNMPIWSLDGMDLSHWLGIPFWSIPYSLDSGGIPFDYLVDQTYDLTRVWVRVWVEGTAYDLDPAFKRYSEWLPKNITSLAGYDRSTFLSTAGGTETADYAQGPNESALSNQLTELSTTFLTNLKESYPNASLEQMAGGRTIHYEEIESLTGQLYFSTSQETEYNALPTTLLHPCSAVYGNLSWQGYMHEIAESGLTLRFSETQATAQSMSAPTVHTSQEDQTLSLPSTETLLPAPPSNSFSLSQKKITQSVTPGGIEYDIDFGTVWDTAPYHESGGVINELFHTYDEEWGFSSNPSAAYSFTPDRDEQTPYQITLHFNGLNQSRGTKTALFEFEAGYEGPGWYNHQYHLSGTVKEFPRIQEGSFGFNAGSKYIAEQRTGTARLKNNGTLSLVLTQPITLTGSDSTHFTLLSGHHTGTIPPGGYRDIIVSYHASQIGLHTEAALNLSFTYDGYSFNWDYLPLSGQTLENVYAQLWRGETLIDQQFAPIDQESLTLSISHPYGTNTSTTVDYPIKLGGTYAIITGFGSSQNGALLKERQKKVRELREAGLESLSPEILSESLHVIGQTWLQETSLNKKLLNNLLSIREVHHHRVGVAAQEKGYYVDIKAQYSSSVATGAHNQQTALITDSLFASAMEHGCLEQLQSSEREAVSTVKLLNIANDNNWKIYRATSNNWNTVNSVLQAGGYTPEERAEFAETLNQRKGLLVLPEHRNVPLGDWSGKGYARTEIHNGLHYVSMIIGGDYHGGYGAFEWDLDTFYQDSLATVNYYDYAESHHPIEADPVDMVTGAYFFDRADLALDGPLPLTLQRHYNSAQHHVKGIMGYGWTHSLNIYAQRHSAYEQALGIRTPEEATAALVAATVVQDLLEHADTPKGWAAAALTTQWMMDQLTDNALSIYIGTKVLTFIEQPDGSYTPPPGITATLTQTDGIYTLQERHGNTYTFNTQNQIQTIADPHGNTLTFDYNAQTNLAALTSSFGPRLDFTYTGDLLSSVTDNTGRSITYQYDSENNLTNVIDAAGFHWSATYDAQHRLTSMTDPQGNTTVQNFYNESGQISHQLSSSGNPWNFYFTETQNTSEDPLGNRTTYYLDEKDRTWSIQQPNGERSYSWFDGQNHRIQSVSANSVTNFFLYDENHNLLTQVDAFGTPEFVITGYKYDSEHHLIALTNAAGSVDEMITEMTYTPTHKIDTMTLAKGTPEQIVTDYDYNANGLTQRLSEGNGQRVTDFTYDAHGNPATVASTDAGTITYTHDIRGDLTSRTLDGKTTRFDYDPRRLPTQTTHPDGTVQTRTYWKNGQLKSATDPRGQTTRHYWTPAYKLAGSAFANGATTTNLYDTADRLIITRDAQGNTTTNTLDQLGRPIAIQTATTTLTHQYDPVGNRTHSALDPQNLNLWTQIQFDALNRPTRTATALSQSEIHYDFLNRATNTIDAAGFEWKTQHDLHGRPTVHTRPTGAHEQTAYNPLGYRVAFTNANGHAIHFGLDAQGRVTAITNALGNVTAFTFDDTGNLTTRLNAEDERTQYGYDSLNRLVTITNEGAQTAIFTHDNNGNLLSSSDADTTIIFGYDEMNRLTASTQTIGSVQSVVQNTYDLNGNLTQIIYPSGLNVSYDFGADNRLEDVIFNGSMLSSAQTISFEYDTANRLTSMDYPNGVDSTFSHDAESRLVGFTHGNFIDRQITRDPRGYKIDELYLKGLAPPAPLTAPNAVGRELDTYEHNPADQLTRLTSTDQTDVTYSYNDNGCLTATVSSTENVDYTYDYDNRIKAVDSIEYLYDASGARIGRVDGSVTNYFVVDYTDGLRRPLAETDASGAITRYYIWSGSMLLCHIESNGDVFYYHADELGSTLVLTDQTGNVTDQFAYMPYGELHSIALTQAGPTQTPYLWLGGYGVYYDTDTDLHLTLHRAYSTQLKRFITPDPLGIDAFANLYAYGDLNPLYFVDPLGLWTFSFGGSLSGNTSSSGGTIGAQVAISYSKEDAWQFGALVYSGAGPAAGTPGGSATLDAGWSANPNLDYLEGASGEAGASGKIGAIVVGGSVSSGKGPDGDSTTPLYTGSLGVGTPGGEAHGYVVGTKVWSTGSSEKTQSTTPNK